MRWSFVCVISFSMCCLYGYLWINGSTHTKHSHIIHHVEIMQNLSMVSMMFRCNERMFWCRVAGGAYSIHNTLFVTSSCCCCCCTYTHTFLVLSHTLSMNLRARFPYSIRWWWCCCCCCSSCVYFTFAIRHFFSPKNAKHPSAVNKNMYLMMFFFFFSVTAQITSADEHTKCVVEFLVILLFLLLVLLCCVNASAGAFEKSDDINSIFSTFSAFCTSSLVCSFKALMLFFFSTLFGLVLPLRMQMKRTLVLSNLFFFFLPFTAFDLERLY